MSDVFSASAQEADTQPVTDAAVVSGPTPGPWETAPEVYSHENGQADWLWIGPSGWRTRVARVVLYDGERAEQEANARLIAAAPDLLEALQYVVRVHAAPGVAPENQPHEISLAMEAIAKAALSDKLGGAS